jgi:flagellar motor protein MotB
MRRKILSKENGDPFSLSVGDLMAGMLAIFILTLMIAMLTYTQNKDTITSGTDHRDVILKNIETRLPKSYSNIVKVETKDGVIRISTNDKAISANGTTVATGIFNSGSEVLTINGQYIISAIGNAIKDSKEELPNDWKYIDTIIIEGHTDTDGYDTGATGEEKRINDIKENLLLSQKRAFSTWDYMRSIKDKNNEPITDYKNSDNKNLFAVAGYGQSRPLLLENGQPNPNKSELRRIEFRFILVPADKILKNVEASNSGSSQ